MLVGGGQEGGGGFQNGYLRADAFPHRTHFQTDHAGANDAEFFRHGSQVQRAFVVQHVFVVDGNLRQRARHRTGGDNHVFGFDDGFFALVVHFDLVEIAVFAFKRTLAVQAGYFVFLEQKGDATGEFGHNRVFALDHFGGIKFHVAHADAVFGKIMLRGVEVFARLQQGFGRDTAHVQAGAAQCGGVAFFVYARVDAGGFETELGGTDGGNVSAGAGADNDNVELRHGVFPLLWLLGCGQNRSFAQTAPF